MSRFEEIVVSIHCLLKVFKASALTFSLSTHAQQLCAVGLLNQGHAIWQKPRKQNIFLQKTYGNFHQFVLAFFLENLIGCICNHDKDVNRRGIKVFSLDHVRAETISSVKFLSACNFMSEKLCSPSLTKLKNQASTPEKISLSV